MGILMDISKLTTHEKERLDRGECIESVFRDWKHVSSDCGKKIKPKDKGGDGFYCGRHLAMYAKRAEAFDARVAEIQVAVSEEARVNAVLMLLDVKRTIRGWPGAVTVNVDDLQKRFAEVWREGETSAKYDDEPNPYEES